VVLIFIGNRTPFAPPLVFHRDSWPFIFSQARDGIKKVENIMKPRDDRSGGAYGSVITGRTTWLGVSTEWWIEFDATAHVLLKYVSMALLSTRKKMCSRICEPAIL
jgi:hypothetical protein